MRQPILSLDTASTDSLAELRAPKEALTRRVSSTEFARAAAGMSIYVEIRIRAPLQDLWDQTQRPELHERWDLRFSEITYLPRPDAAQPQRFRYATRIGGGLTIEGEGESVGAKDLADSQRVSALSFSSADPRSLILSGSGYWKYIPTADGIRFLTRYDYETRFGRFGRLVDRLAFRPLIGWATAWSFDRLRLLLEQDIDPRSARRQWLTHAVARVGLAIIFAYHGLVPKLLLQNPDESAMLRDVGVSSDKLHAIVVAFGFGEILFAVCLLAFWRFRWPAVLIIVFAFLATIGVAYGSPRYFGGAFNPLSLNLAILCLAVVDLLNLPGSPTASNCLRTPPSDQT